MKINEVETLLGLSRANIRFYEKEGLLSPKRGENRYRDYDEEDLRRLRIVMLLRRLDLPLEDVRRVLDGALPLAAAARQQSERLRAQLKETKNARELCGMLERQNESVSAFQPQAYLEEIERRERRGEQFRALADDVLDFAGPGLRLFLPVDSGEMLRRLGQWRMACVLLVLCIAGGFAQLLIWHESFWIGFLRPLIVCGFLLLFSLGFVLLRRRSEKAAVGVAKVFLILILLFFLFLGAVIVYGALIGFS